ncbi:ABC transporter permease/ATP-binding protein [Leptospira ryugenii]|uniref:ABC transporter permease/ATP-binding protein n=1 Tax=Leptospira ryugenii TaxID=1917863 RepID=A0A2P2DZT0_9LEPT|nr:ABC transporter ATP-binding protein [Leptospira ryugenii]GBF50135.1 ABC transporter permease/ATP-binding protein [Leptospira ryugenii]
MKIYKKLWPYLVRYKYRLTIGVFLSIFVSIFNGVSLTSLIPIFDSLGSSENYKFQLALTKADQEFLKKQESEVVPYTLEWGKFYFARTKSYINQELAKRTPDELVYLFCLIIIPIYLLKMICLAGTIYFVNSAGLLSVRDLRMALYLKLQDLPLNDFLREKTGILMSRIINDVDTVGKVVSNDLKDAINDFFSILIHLAILLILSWELFFLIFIVIPFILGPVNTLAERIRKSTKSQQDRLSALNGDLQEVISGIRVIRAFSMEAHESQRFFDVNHDLSEKTFKNHFYHQVGPAMVELSGSIVTMIFLGIGAYLLEDPGFSRGKFLVFFITLIFLMRPLKQMGILNNLVQASASAGERVFEILNRESDIKEAPNSVSLGPLGKEILYQNVSYVYPGTEKYALRSLNLRIPKGGTIAIVGSSGAGKSTLIDLLPRLIDPTEGAILWDGVDARQLKIGNLRRRIGVVSQNIFLFNGTIRENISYGKPEASEEEIRKAADDAFATEFIESFEEGFDTIVGERGVMLSGGQRQRISIARTLLADPEVLVLDEATSALDTESERLIQQAFVRLYHNKTVIIIAHRLSTVKIADTIYYIEDGEIKESGSHQDLLAIPDSKYKRLYDLQFQVTNST